MKLKDEKITVELTMKEYIMIDTIMELSEVGDKLKRPTTKAYFESAMKKWNQAYVDFYKDKGEIK